MAKTQFLTYYIVLTDAAKVAAYQVQYPKGVNRAPWDASNNGGAAVEFAAPWRGYLESALGAAPYTWTPWSGAGSNDGPYPINVATFTRKTGGFWGIGGTTTKYFWIGQFVLASQTEAAPEDAPPGVTVYIPQRRWCEGFEIPGQICGKTTAILFSRDASRHTDGFGLRITGQTGTTNILLSSFTGLGTPTQSWDRLYACWRNGGTTPFPIMQWHAAPSAGAGVILTIMPNGQIALENVTSGNVRSILGTFGQLVLDEWAKVDIVTQFNDGLGGNGGDDASVDGQTIRAPGIALGVVNGQSTLTVTGAVGGLGTTGFGPYVISDHDTSSARAWVTVAGDTHVYDTGQALTANKVWSTTLLGGGLVQLWINGAPLAAIEVPPGSGGLGTAGQTLASIEIGNVWGVTDDTEIDVDDWVSSALPLDSTGKVNYGGADFTQGSKVRLIRPTGFGGAHANWTGDFRNLLQNGMGAWTTKAVLSSAVSGAVLEATTDYAQSILQDPQSLGPVAMQVSLQSLRGAAPSGTLGYNVNGAGAVDAAIVQTAGHGPNAVMYRPVNGTKLPTDWVSVLLRHVKAADTSTGQVATLLAQVEMVGAFFDEDRPTRLADPPPTLPSRVGIHNAPYDRSPWALDGMSAPTAPVIIIGGTYTGNGTGQDLSFRAPVHWLFIRNTAGGQPGGIWWSSMLTPHRNGNLGIEAVYAVQAFEDQTFVPGAGQDTQQQRYKIRLAGNDTQVNANAATYEYIAVSDPGGRFLLNMAQAHRAALPVYRAALVNAGFTPEWAFYAFEDLTNTSTTHVGVKGPGHATESVTRSSGTTTTLALAFSAGAITGKAVFWALVGHLQVAFSLWRRHDGNNDPGEAAVFSIGSYTGDGTASRTVTAGTAGKRPLFAIVQPENATGLVRDPSHTTVTSQQWPGGTANASTGITGGAPDSISVGSVLNTNGVVHHYFILWGGTTAGNGGFSANGEFTPVEANAPTDGPWPPDPTEADFTSTPAVTPSAPVSEPDLAAACVATTQKVVNISLAHIGVSQQIGDLVNETSQEAVTSRLHIKDDVEAVLYRFPWRRAKRYANLVLVGGTATVPVNNDWQYSYRAPSDMVRVRRITSQTGTKRQYDPNPIAFEVGSDATGDLIFTDAVATVDLPVQLEYTARLTCPAAQLGQPFRDALAWKHAASLAPALSKDPGKAQYCEAKYRDVVITTDVIDATEEQPQKPNDGDAPWITGR